jgi:hypothetical protein
MEKVNKTSRESETRKSKEAPKVWTPPSSLDAPPAPKGYAHRWIRVSVQGFEDTSNVSKKLREGWEFVSAEQVEKENGSNKYPVFTEGKYQGLIGIGGLVLARIPEEILLQRQAYFDKITQDRMEAVDRELLKEQHPDMPINIDRQSRVTFGGSRKK